MNCFGFTRETVNNFSVYLLLFYSQGVAAPHNAYYLRLNLQNFNENPIQMQYKPAGAASFQKIDVPARYQQTYNLPFTRTAGLYHFFDFSS